MRGAWLALVLLTAGACRRADADGFRFVPVRWEVDAALTGDGTRGYGAAVAFGDDGEPYVGAPFQGPGQVYRGTSLVLEGTDGDFLGSSLAGGGPLLVGAPGRSAVLDESGDVVLELEGVLGVGGRVVRHVGGVAALGRGAVVGEGGFEVGERLWSLAAPELDGKAPTVVAGLASGGIVWAGGRLAGGEALGRGLLACDVDRDGDDDLVVSDPLSGWLRVFAVDDIADVDLGVPTAAFQLGPGAGHALACARGGVLVGAPERTRAGVAWIAEPAVGGEPVWLDAGSSRSSFGFSLAVGQGSALVGDPGLGEVLVLRPIRR